jgi:MinD superfamily P-loop ATPase
VIISVASGKGGTGKTTVAVNMALSLKEPVQFLDCDVEEPNAHLFLHPLISQVKPVFIPVPKVDESLCDFCGKCGEFCQFHAIAVVPKKVIVFPELCHGCGGCRLICPSKAIVEENRQIGVIKLGQANHIQLAYGEINPGEPMPGPIIRELKKHTESGGATIIDAPPGTSCPVIESVYGSDYCVIVTEPTPFGLHDMKLMVDVLRRMEIPFGAVVNRAGVGDEKVYDYCQAEGIPVLLKIPFERRIAEAYSRGVAFTQVMPEWGERFSSLFSIIAGGICR